MKSGPFAPRALPRFPATMGRSDSRPWPSAWLWLPARRCTPRAPRRVSQDPRRLDEQAPSPATPDDSPSASARCFLDDDRLHHLWKVGRRQPRNEVESGSHPLGLPPLLSRAIQPARTPSHDDAPVRFARESCLARAGRSYMCERAIHMADSFQSARVARVILAHQSAPRGRRTPRPPAREGLR